MTSDSITDFPDLSEEQLRILFTGSYQLKQSVSYLAEVLDETDTMYLKYHRDNTNILKMEVQSRHCNANKYRCYIDYVPDSRDIEGIKRHYCECKNGARTIGCCSHIATVIYFLSNARYQYRIIRPAEILTTLFRHDESVPVIADHSDDDD